MDINIRGNVSINTKIDVAAGATYIHTKIDHVDTFCNSVTGYKPQSGGMKQDKEIVELFSPFFKPDFKGRNPLKTDYLPILVEDIMSYRLPKDMARIANMLYNSKELVNKPSSFAQWYKLFCEICGCAHKTYDQNKVDDFDVMKKRFYYLNF